MIDAGLVLLGAGGGALWRYLRDQRLLHIYGELVGQLTKSLKTEVEHERELEEKLRRESLHERADEAEAGRLS